MVNAPSTGGAVASASEKNAAKYEKKNRQASKPFQSLVNPGIKSIRATAVINLCCDLSNSTIFLLIPPASRRKAEHHIHATSQASMMVPEAAGGEACGNVDDREKNMSYRALQSSDVGMHL
ncbi:hypothetical protein JG688_00011223 [Phytophthora aleatoria]|uniref:Uncharacterized protein n=1 Tax=Phytophthora aleatoria TaxID=2496075 RepID=A0A8J5M148_9STRA|nr:hypothetical protein JG688_00011223 [Phytophthora aleatoria]